MAHPPAARGVVADTSRIDGAPRLDPRLFIACGLSVGAGLIHVQATVWHVTEYAPFAAFFALLAAAQFLWAAAIYRSPTRRLVAAGALLSLGTVVIWLVSRTSGLPFGPEHWTREPVAPADAIATADEAVLALLGILYLQRSDGGLRRALRAGAAVAGVALISLSSLTFMFSGHAQ